MSRRSKLSLVPNKDLEKKQAAGFEVAAPASGPARADTPPPRAQRGAPGAREAASARGEKLAAAPRASASRTGGRPWLKVVAVVVVTALALFLLKRRII